MNDEESGGMRRYVARNDHFFLSLTVPFDLMKIPNNPHGDNNLRLKTADWTFVIIHATAYEGP